MASQHRLAEAQRLAHLGSWHWDIQNNTIEWSDEHYRIFGVNRALRRLVPKRRAVHPPDDRAMRRQRLQAASS